MRQHYVHDYETMINLFVAVFESVNTEETHVFICHESKNDILELITFLEHNITYDEWHVSFNGLAFDSQITEHIIRNKDILTWMEGDEIANWIYNKAQDTISRSNRNEFLEFSSKKLSIKQIDVFKLNHWDNANKRSSLKWIQFSMDWPTIMDMPIHHKTAVTAEQIPEIVSYCINDVKSTKAILHLSKPLINVRKDIKNKYGLDCYSFSNTKLGSELLLSLYCNNTGKSKYEVKEYRTYRNGINIKDIVFKYISFKTAPFQMFLNKILTQTIWDTKNDFKYNVRFQGYSFDYGTGGIHQCIEPGIYLANEEYIIKDLDVASLYPSIACMNKMYPAHLGEDFFQVYKNNIVDVRLAEKSKPKDQRDIAIIEGFKEAANATYGNSNSEYSWLYDSSYTMQTTINGQLLLTMLVEELLISIPDSMLLQTNTDGATLRFKKEHLSIYENICKEWENLTKLTLEFADYKAMYIWDVNNYISVYTDGKSKCKGRFEWEDLENHKYTHLHKNKSFLVIPKAIHAYFVNGIQPEEFIKSCSNIFDFCGGVKIKGDWEFKEVFIEEGDYKEKPLQNTLRYYISNKGSKILKCNKSDKRIIQVEAGKWLQKVYIIHEEKNISEYDINYDYYLNKIKKDIETLEPSTTQLLLF